MLHRMQELSLPAIACSKLTIEVVDKGANMYQFNNKDTRTTPIDAVLVSLLLNLKNLHLVLMLLLFFLSR